MTHINSRNWLTRLADVFKGEPKNHQDLVTIIEEAEKNKLLKPDATAMIKGAIAVSELRVEDVMVPRSQMVTLEEKQPLNDMLKTIIESGHSRFPVIGKSLDEVKGLLLAKDLLRHFMHCNEEEFDLGKLLRPITTIPERKRLDLALKEFRNHTHIALVVDEHGILSGLITIEDIIEEVVGDIEDEYDLDERGVIQIKKVSDKRYIIDALTPIEDINEHFHTKLSDKNFDTIGGLLTHKLGHVPKKGEVCELGTLHLKVIKADQRRAIQLALEYHEQ